jgi:hypothetical protein
MWCFVFFCAGLGSLFLFCNEMSRIIPVHFRIADLK